MKNLIVPLCVLFLMSCGNEVSSTKETEAVLVEKPSNIEMVKEAIPDSIKELEVFLLENHAIKDQSSGDLNNDGIEDVILIQYRKDERTTYDEAVRPLMLLIRDETGKLSLAKRNDKTVYCFSCGGAMGDPYMGITIKGKYFSFEHYGGSGGHKWSHIITYKYDTQKRDWLLHKDGGEYFGWNEDESDEAEAIVKKGETILTKKDFGEVLFEEYDIYAD